MKYTEYFDIYLSTKIREYEQRRNQFKSDDIDKCFKIGLLREEKAIAEQDFLENELFQIIKYSYTLINRESFQDWSEGFSEEVDYLEKLRSTFTTTESETFSQMRSFIETGSLKIQSVEDIVQKNEKIADSSITFFKPSKERRFNENMNAKAEANIIKYKQEIKELCNGLSQHFINKSINPLTLIEDTEPRNADEEKVFLFLKTLQPN